MHFFSNLLKVLCFVFLISSCNASLQNYDDGSKILANDIDESVLSDRFYVSSPVSHVMILELKETNKSIIIYNTQGQKIRNVLLHQQEDPYSDQRINSTKGDGMNELFG